MPDGLQINEFMARPASDWNEDGTADKYDEYIELINHGSQPFDLSGLKLDDAEGGSPAYPLSGILAEGEIAVFFRTQTGLALNDTGGDSVRLLAADGTVIDQYSYASATSDQAWSRDDEGSWHDDWLASPQEVNRAPTATSTPTSS